MSKSGVATFPWDIVAENPSESDGQSLATTGFDNGSGLQLPQAMGQDFPQDGGLLLRNTSATGADDPQVPGGLVLPGGGQIAQADGTVNLSPKQVDMIIAQNLKNGRIPGKKEELRSGLEIELEIPNRLLKKLQQTDGGLGEDDEDDDINSDLDDSDEDQDDDDDDDDTDNGMIMLCLYDKVQRVKNKWKYVLKDGIANINGKDYLFSKATGESEW